MESRSVIGVAIVLLLASCGPGSQGGGDAGLSSDAGRALDGGRALDAGSSRDSGGVSDAGCADASGDAAAPGCATLCGSNAHCDESTGQCACDPGYEGDASAGCTDLDECATGSAGCDAIAECHNTEGSFECSCPDFHTADGTSCVLHEPVIDQYHAGSGSGLHVTPTQRVGQTFTIGVEGRLVGLDLELSRSTDADPRFSAIVEVRDPSGAVVATRTFPDADVPLPAPPLSRAVRGPTYFDLSSEELLVHPGEVWSFLVGETGDDTCDTSGAFYVCRAHPTQPCLDDSSCGGDYRLGYAPSDAYGGGELFIEGPGTAPAYDLSFRTEVLPR